MKRTVLHYSLSMVLLIVALSTSAEAISKRKLRPSLKQRSHVELRFGVQDHTNIDNDYYYYDGFVTRRNNNDLIVSFGYNYFVDDQTAFSVALKVLAADDESGVDAIGVYDAEYGVVPIFFGFRHYLGQRRSPSPVRPYVTIMGGPVIGSEKFTVISNEIYEFDNTYTAAGAHFGGGIDFIAGRHFTFGLNAGYNLLSDFSEPVGGHVNYSGAEFGIGFGYLF